MQMGGDTAAKLCKSVVDGLPYATALFSPELKYIYYNKSAELLTGVPLDQAVGKSPTDILPAHMHERLIPLMKEAFQSQRTIIERIEFNIKGNETILGVQFVPLLDEEKNVQMVMGTIEDWTKIENQRSEAMASSRLASLGHMAANITHEINNPLQLIQLRLFKLEDIININPKNTTGMLKEIKEIFSTINRVSRIVESVRRQSKQITPEKLKSIVLCDVVAEAITYTKDIIEKSKTELILDIDTKLQVLCNPIEIEQVLINLISNSCYAIKEEKEHWIKVSAKLKRDQVIIKVQDSGAGISKKIQKNLMKPFFTTKNSPQGTGLGLNLSKTLIKRNNGELKYLPDSLNTTFQFNLKTN